MNLQDDFKPPIKERDTKQLLKIVASSDKWNKRAVRLAEIELKNRKVDYKQIKQAKYIARKEDELEELRKANESYSLFGVLANKLLIFEILFSWELKKDGYLRKAKQQKKIRIWLLIIIVVLKLLT